MNAQCVHLFYIGLYRSHVPSCEPKTESNRDESKWAPVCVCVLVLILYLQPMDLLGAFALYFEMSTPTNKLAFDFWIKVGDDLDCVSVAFPSGGEYVI